jgi:hypothetical protein
LAQWEQAGLATQRKVVQVELGAKFVCWWKCEIGLCESGAKRMVMYSIIFFSSFFINIKKKKKWIYV